MKFYGDKEAQRKELQGRIESYRNAANLAPVIIKTLRQFDGKIYNCKLDKALREATTNKAGASVDSMGYIEIYTTYTTNYYHLTYSRFSKDKLENKRIDAEKIIEEVKAAREQWLKKAYDLESTADQGEQIKQYIRDQIEKLEKYCRSLPDDLRDIYDIPYYIRTN